MPRPVSQMTPNNKSEMSHISKREKQTYHISENIGEYIYDFGVGQDLSARTLRH